MFGFEITSDLLIVAIFAQTIAISLIILIIYFKIIKIHYKNIDLSEKIDEKLDRVESKLSYLSNQVLVISANEDKFKYPRSSFDPSAYYRNMVPTHEESDSQSLLKGTTLYGQNSSGSKKVDPELTATATTTASNVENSQTKPLSEVETSSFSQPKSESTIAPSSSSDAANNSSFSEISSSNKPSDAVAEEPRTDFVQKSNGPTTTNSFNHNDYIEKNTNPEIDKIEKEILTALKRLGGANDDYCDLNVYDDSIRDEEDVIYPAAKKSDRKVKNFD